MTLKLALGIILLIISSLSLILNLLMAGLVFRFAFDKYRNNIYVLSAFSILFDISHNFLTISYLAPGMITDSYIYSNSQDSSISILIGTLFVFLWNIKNATQILISINRFLVLCYNSTFFTKLNICLIYILLMILCAINAYVSQYWLPCCSFIIDQHFYSYSFILQNDTFNYMNFSELSFDGLTIIITLICYYKMQIYIENTLRNLPVTMINNMRKRQAYVEINFAAIYFAIAMPHTLTWIIFRIVFSIFGENSTVWYFGLSVIHVLNCSMHAFFIFVANREMQLYVRDNGYLCMKAKNDENIEIPMQIIE
ncbi:unnamed protein product [Caenorhabditis angaria]|uniref:Uncharacterized protein n=1 Tax=Caenorhabditis angaria TaxID=860376 RepID=A0A9P1IX13_9PELO|nr:unnamed protein product [Caenorhabditis angaria]